MGMDMDHAMRYTKTLLLLMAAVWSSNSAFAQDQEVASAPDTASENPFVQVQKLADSAIAKRDEKLKLAETALEEAKALLDQKDFVKSLAKFREVLDMFPTPTPAVAHIQNPCYDGAALCLIELAKEDVASGQLDSARSRADEALAFAPEDNRIQLERVRVYKMMGLRLDFKGRPVVHDDPSYTPTHVKNITDVKNKLAQGVDLMQSGKYEEAETRFREVLTVDPYNAEARSRMSEVLKHKMRYARTAHEQQRNKMMTELMSIWEMPITRRSLTDAAPEISAPISRTSIADIERRMKSTILPVVSFDEEALVNVVEFLRAKSRELDPERRGINFFVDPKVAENPVSLTLANVPMSEVLKYAARVANVKPTIGENVVSLLPMSASAGDLLRKSYTVRREFFDTKPKKEDESGSTSRRSRRSKSKAKADVGSTAGADVRAVFEQNGVTFPQGSWVQYVPSTGILTVNNTPENHELIDALVGTDPGLRQIEVEAKFIEIAQNDLDEVSTAMNMVKNGNYTSALATPRASRENMNGFNQLDGLRSNGDISQNSVENLLFGASTTQSNQLNTQLSVLNFNIDILVRALSQKQSFDLMSAPKITARNGEMAKIKAVRRFWFPDTFNPPTLPPPANVTLGVGVSMANSITPAFPSNFQEKQLGVSLEVTPTILASGDEVNIDLVPMVDDFEGFINYGEPIPSPGGSITAGPFVTQNVINMPVFNTRKVTTSVSVRDGNTIMLGGLMREDTKTIDDKVPLLGDIPLIGRAFRSKVEQTLKKNLIVFVTPRIVDERGELVNKPTPPPLSATTAVNK